MTKFETITCSRCGGSGQYSYNMIDGTRCFKCSGSKVVLSKRGHAARLKFIELTTKSMSQVKVGDVMWYDSMGEKKCWRVIEEISDYPAMPDSVQLKMKGAATMFIVSLNRPIRTAASMEEVKEKLAAALEYQSTLTAAGTVKKR